MRLPDFRLGDRFSRFADWSRGHESFFAVRLARILAVLLIVTALLFLMRATGLLDF